MTVPPPASRGIAALFRPGRIVPAVDVALIAGLVALAFVGSRCFRHGPPPPPAVAPGEAIGASAAAEHALPPVAVAADAAAHLRERVSSGADWVAELRTWAAADPAAALAWARSISDETRIAALVAVLEGAADNPTEAARLGRELLQAEPALAADCEPALVGALIRANAFGLALEFVQSGPAELRAASLTTLFAAWVRRDPAFAGEVATMFGAQGLRGHAFDAVMRSWASVAPTQAIGYALNLPPGEAREIAYQAALPRWVAQNPAAVANLLDTLTQPAEHDDAAYALICGTDQLNRTTMTALNWAEGIASPALREKALAHVLPEWAAQDPAAAASYVESAPGLSGTERESLRAVLRPPPPDGDT